MRVWLDRDALAATGITVGDVEQTGRVIDALTEWREVV